MLRGEHPQTVALILAHLEAQHTASVLKELDPVFGAEVVLRMARMEKVSPDMLVLIERSILTETDLRAGTGTDDLGWTGRGGRGAQPRRAVAREGDHERRRSDATRRSASRFATSCSSSRTSSVSTTGRSSGLLREIDVKELALALKSASNEVKNKIMGGMSQRASAALKEEMEMLGPARKRDIESAQTAIVAMIRKLEDAGEIVVGGGADDLVA